MKILPIAVLAGAIVPFHLACAATQARKAASQYVPSSINTPAPGHHRSFHGPVVYAAPTSRGVVDVYTGGPKMPAKPIYSFSLNPGVENSLQVDRHGNLFFADSYSTWVYEYAPGTNTPLKSFPTSETPNNIALRGDTLYVFQSQEDGGDASIQIYENGHTQPDRALSDPAISTPDGLAVDAAGNVFVAYNESSVGEFVGGQMPLVPLALQGVSLPLALAIDGAGNLLVDSVTGDHDTSAILIYPPGQTTPARKIRNLPWLYQFSLTADGKYFYTGDSGQGNAFQMYEYPRGKLVYAFTDPQAFAGFAGIAASPALRVGTW